MDIGSRCVKMAQVEASGGHVRLVRGVAIPRDRPWPEFEAPLNSSPRSSHEEIKTGLLLMDSLSGRSAACLLPMSVQELRSVEVPEADGHEQRQMIVSQLDDLQMPNQIEFDFWNTIPPHSQTDRPAENVNVMLVSRPWTHQVATDLMRSKLDCRALDGPPLALARAVRMSTSGSVHEPIAAFDWGYRSATLTIVIDGLAVYTRRLRDCQLSRLVTAVANDFDISNTEAESLLFNRQSTALKSPTANEARRLLNEVASELERTFQYLRGQRQAIAPQHAWVFGGGSLINDVTDLLNVKTSLPVQRWPGPAHCDPDALDGDCPTTLLATAIALSALAFE